MPLGQQGCAAERSGGAGKKMAGHKSGKTSAEQKTRNIYDCDLKANSKYKAEQMKDSRTKSLKK